MRRFVEPEDADNLICLNRKCHYKGEKEEFISNYAQNPEDGEEYEWQCPHCHGTNLTTVGEYERALYDDAVQQKLDEMRGK